MLDVPELKLPRMEPGHTAPDQKMPRVEGVGVKDDVAHSEYPKWVQCPVRGAMLVMGPEDEAAILASSASSDSEAVSADESGSDAPVKSSRSKK